MEIYTEIAVKYGEINTDDPNAVNRFFENDVYLLPEKTRLKIIDALLSQVGEISQGNVAKMEHEEVPFPDPGNYVRADSQPKLAEIPNGLSSINVDNKLLAGMDALKAESTVHHAISALLVKLAGRVRRFENIFHARLHRNHS
jgi:hypothetical protein